MSEESGQVLKAVRWANQHQASIHTAWGNYVNWAEKAVRVQKLQFILEAVCPSIYSLTQLCKTNSAETIGQEHSECSCT